MLNQKGIGHLVIPIAEPYVNRNYCQAKNAALFHERVSGRVWCVKSIQPPLALQQTRSTYSKQEHWLLSVTLNCPFFITTSDNPAFDISIYIASLLLILFIFAPILFLKTTIYVNNEPFAASLSWIFFPLKEQIN